MKVPIIDLETKDNLGHSLDEHATMNLDDEFAYKKQRKQCYKGRGKAIQTVIEARKKNEEKKENGSEETKKKLKYDLFKLIQNRESIEKLCEETLRQKKKKNVSNKINDCK